MMARSRSLLHIVPQPSKQESIGQQDENRIEALSDT